MAVMNSAAERSLESITAPATAVNHRQDLLAANLLGRAMYSDVSTGDKGLHDLVGELRTRSDELRQLWGAHNVRIHGAGTKTFHHDVVGDLTPAYETMELRVESDLIMSIYAAEPDSATAHAPSLLASWAATSPSTADR